MDNDHLEHFGVLGMHWGRRSGSIASISSLKKSSAYSTPIPKVSKIKKKLNPQKVIDGKNLSEALINRGSNIVLSQLAGLALVNTGHFKAGVILAAAGAYYNVGRGLGEVLDRRE